VAILSPREVTYLINPRASITRVSDQPTPIRRLTAKPKIALRLPKRTKGLTTAVSTWLPPPAAGDGHTPPMHVPVQQGEGGGLQGSPPSMHAAHAFLVVPVADSASSSREKSKKLESICINLAVFIFVPIVDYLLI